MDYGGSSNAPQQNPTFYSPETGIYRSKHRSASLPRDPLTDLVSFVFSHPHGGSTALVDAGTGSSIGYADLRRNVASFASGLSRIGIASEDVVLVMLPNSIIFPVVFLGILSAGAIFSAMNPLSSHDEIKKQTAQCRFSLVLTTLDNVAKLRGLDIKVVPVPEEPEFDADEFALFKNLISTDPKSAPRPVIRQTDTAAILFSSGTTGASKGVLLTHRNLIAAVELFVRFERLQYDGESWRNVFLAVIPMFHVYGLSLFSMGLLSLGTTIVVMRRFYPEDAIRIIDRYKVTHFPVVPPIVVALARAKGTAGSRLESLEQVSCGAAPVSQRTMDCFLAAYPRVDFIQGYGLTESSAVGTRGFNTANSKRHNSVGFLAPNMEAKMIDLETGSCLPPGSSGELWLRGPGIMKGYLHNERETCSTIVEDGWLKTGDIACFDEDGYLYILDRLKETIKYKGFQISPADLEAVLITHPRVLDAAVTSAKDEQAGEIPVAFVVRRAGGGPILSAEEVMEFVAKQVTPYKKVRKVVFVNSIPRSAAGKILRRKLKDNLQASSRM